MSLPADRPETAGGQVELRTRGRPHSMHLPPHPALSPTDDAAKPLRRPLSHGEATAVGDGGGGELMLLMYVLGGREVGQVTVFRRPLSVWRLDLTRLWYTDKKENKIYLIFKEMQNDGAGAKSYMNNGLLIYGEIFAVLILWLYNCSNLNFLIYEENLIFFLSV